MDSSFTVLSCPSGQAAGAADSLIERRTSKVVAQSLQRYSYVGTRQLCTATNVTSRASS
jgi:hypothetical protein